MTPEAKVKRHLREQCEARGWQCLVLVDTVRKKWPDRTLIAPGGRIAFVEVKATGAPMENNHVREQVRRIQELTALGFPAFLVEGTRGVDVMVSVLIGKGWPELYKGLPEA